MLRRIVVAGGTAAAVFASMFVATTSAAPFRPQAFNSLRGELEHRRDNDFSGTLDKTQKKQQKTVVKSLATIAKDSKNFGVDIKNAGKLAKGLEAAFPDEFHGPVAIANLGEVVNQMFNELHTFLEADFADQEGRDDALSEKGTVKVEGYQDAATEVLADARNSPYPDWAKALSAAYKLWSKAEKTIAKDKGPGGSGGGKEFLKATIGGAKWESDKDTRAATYNNLVGLVVIAGTKVGLPAKILNITPQAVSGPGTYTISIASYTEAGLPPKSYQVTNAGTITFTVFDTVNLRIAGTFSFTANGVAGTTGSVVVEGEFDMKYVNAGI